ncbi:MAG TPA: hypothetical protein VK879_19505 [Candidatus Sulfomarinibacteraceae bacterium]|nr:hypothetical protein [Candidatus Sulfomarinibacteraceae bacterium]
MDNLRETLAKNRTRLIVLAILAILLLMAIQGMSTRDWVVTLLRGLSVGAITFLVAAGLSIILGLMDVLNLAHGTMFMIGAFLGWSVYVRPDTFVDGLAPVALLAAGFMLMPLWSRLLAGRRLSPAVARIWPWFGLALGAGLAAVTLARAPLAMWDPAVYNDSPIVWTQALETGQLNNMLAPATLEGGSPLLIFGGLLLGSVLLALSLSGLGRRRGSAERSGPFPWRNLALFLLVVVLAAGAHLFNDPLTHFLLAMDSAWRFLLAAVVATAAGAVLGGVMEASLIRPLYERPIYQLMLTFGLAFIGTEVVRAIWGRTGFTMPKPSIFAQTGGDCPATTLAGWLDNHCATLAITIQGETARIRTYNEIFIIVVGLVVLVAVWLLLQRSRLGMIIRAGVQDSEMVEALGINVRRVFTLVFALGVGLAALGGVLAAPAMGLSDAMGTNLLLGALIALAIGGLTSYPGAAAGALLVGLMQQFIIRYGQIGINLPFLAEPFKPSPPLVPASTVLLMVIILLLLPQGLLGREEA